ncbi:MAG: XkdF-like putative serine protease domain-containing protein [Eubacteriales bacterium]
MKNNFKVLKSDDERRQVFGWASVAVRVTGEVVCDHQDDIIEPEVLEQAAYDYVVNFGVAGEMHENSHVGKLIESVVFTEEKAEAMGIPSDILPQGWWVGFQIYDLEVWQKIKDGTYTMFSIEGTADRVPEANPVKELAQEIAELLSRKED